jgi:hypothetical protein
METIIDTVAHITGYSEAGKFESILGKNCIRDYGGYSFTIYFETSNTHLDRLKTIQTVRRTITSTHRLSKLGHKACYANFERI